MPPSVSSAPGACVATLNSSETRLRLFCTHAVIGVTGVHLHQGAADTAGPTVLELESLLSPVVATWTLPAGALEELRAGRVYVDVHSTAFPDGELRGQIE